MALFIPRRIAREIVARHGYLEIERHDLVDEAGAAREAHVLRCADWVTVVAVTPAGDFVLVRQHRYGIGAVTLEAAGGIIDPGEEPEAAALRELREETGHVGSSIEPLGVVHPNP